MKKTIITIGASALIALSANAQGLIAGWDFADVTNLAGTNVNGYAAEASAVNNGFATSGTIYVDGTNGSTNLTQGSEVFFAANGAAAGNPGFGDGFDQTTTDLFGGLETGQQSINFDETGGAFNITFGFTAATDVVVNMDWLTESSTAFTDILQVSYSNDGSSFTTYNKAGNTSDGYYGGGQTATWAQSTGDNGGAATFLSGQTDMTIDLTGLGEVSYVRFEFQNLGANERVGLDNVHIAGTAVPEPSAYAAIAGALALAFVASRRRK